MKYISRLNARQQLDLAKAVRAANTDKKDYVGWRNDMKEVAQ